MTGVYLLSGTALLGALLSLLLRRVNRELAAAVGIAAGVLVLLGALSPLRDALASLKSLSARADLSQEHLQTLLTLLGGTLVVELTAQWCRDAGEDSIARHLMLGGQWLLLSLTLPALLSIGERLMQLLS